VDIFEVRPFGVNDEINEPFRANHRRGETEGIGRIGIHVEEPAGKVRSRFSGLLVARSTIPSVG